MTRHPPAINCQCETCDRYHVKAVLRAYADRKNVSCETTARRFLEQREKGKPPVDPDAEQLAAAIREAFRLLPDKFKRDPAEIAATRDAARHAADPDAEQLAADVAGLAGNMLARSA